MLPHLKVIKSGLFTTIQDAGRFGYAHIGVPKSGVMDTYAYRFANTLLGNDENAAVIEMLLQGGTFQLTHDAEIVVSGAACDIWCNDIKKKEYQVIAIKANERLTIGNFTNGNVVYLAIKGGFQTKDILGSKSFYTPVTTIQRFKNGDKIPYLSNLSINATTQSSVVYDAGYLVKSVINVFKGPEYALLDTEQQALLARIEFEISTTSNRMAYQMDNSIENTLPSILTVPVLPGTVQLTPSGKLIVLMKDCQTTGGYPRILQVSETSLHVLAQKQFKTNIRFEIQEF